jgi:hypothetical protein
MASFKRFPNGDTYMGSWRDGEMHGKGVYTSHAGLDTEQGVCKEVSGIQYDGQWKDGKKHGIGVQTWAGGESDGAKYEGDWAYSRMVGVCILLECPVISRGDI